MVATHRPRWRQRRGRVGRFPRRWSSPTIPTRPRRPREVSEMVYALVAAGVALVLIGAAVGWAVTVRGPARWCGWCG